MGFDGLGADMEGALQLLAGQRRSAAAVIDDPFKIRNLESIWISIRKNHITAKVEFEEGSCGGTRSFKGKSLVDLVEQIEGYLRSLEGR